METKKHAALTFFDGQYGWSAKIGGQYFDAKESKFTTKNGARMLQILTKATSRAHALEILIEGLQEMLQEQKNYEAKRSQNINPDDIPF